MAIWRVASAIEIQHIAPLVSEPFRCISRGLSGIDNAQGHRDINLAQGKPAAPETHRARSCAVVELPNLAGVMSQGGPNASFGGLFHAIEIPRSPSEPGRVGSLVDECSQ